jgi:catalase
LKDRTVGILVDDGTDFSDLRLLMNAVRAAHAQPEIIAKSAGRVRLSNGEAIVADHILCRTVSRKFDAVAVIVSDQGCASLMRDAGAVMWLADAFCHLKAVGYTAGARPLLERAGVILDRGGHDSEPNSLSPAASNERGQILMPLGLS